MKEEEGVQLSTDQEWNTALEVVRRLYKDGHLCVLFRPFGGIPKLSLDEERTPEYVRGTALETEGFRQIFREEISLLLFPVVSGMADSELVGGDTPFADLSEEEKQMVVQRRKQLEKTLFTGRLSREYQTKMGGAGLALADVDTQIFGVPEAGGTERAESPIAVLRIEGEPPRRFALGDRGGGPAGLFRWLTPGEAESITLICTRSDVEYLCDRLSNIARQLAALDPREDNDEDTE